MAALSRNAPALAGRPAGCAEGENQVAAERLSYQQDRRSKAVHHRTIKIRAAIAEATALRRSYQHDEHLNSAAVQRNNDPDHVARLWLRQFHKDAYHADIYQPLLTARELPPHLDLPSFGDIHESIEYACGTGLIQTPVSAAVQALLTASDLRLADVTADDCRDQDVRNTDLRHPLLLRRWG